MIHIYIESGIKRSAKGTTNEYDFIEKFISLHFPNREMGVDYQIQGWDGKDHWYAYQPIFQQQTDRGDKNILIFDADHSENGGDYSSRIQDYEQKKIDFQIDFDLFLWPNHQDDGDFETMLEKLTQEPHTRILRSFEDFEKSIDGYNKADGKLVYHIPNQKNKIYTYISTIIKSNEEEKNFSKGFWAFENPNYWNLTHPYLDKLKAFLRSSCSW